MDIRFICAFFCFSFYTWDF